MFLLGRLNQGRLDAQNAQRLRGKELIERRLKDGVKTIVTIVHRKVKILQVGFSSKIITIFHFNNPKTP